MKVSSSLNELLASGSASLKKALALPKKDRGEIDSPLTAALKKRKKKKAGQ